MNPNEIAAHHRSRLALIYVRQSSPHQVLHHRESQHRQRSFQQRAADLRWPLEQITVIDEDLGESATRRYRDRTGFQNMVAEAALGHIGIILSLELSHLSRRNQDWYHLLDICAVTQTLLADEEGLYDPRAYNDRLLLGLKGTMSEAEIHIMKQRLIEAMHSKARRGELCFRLPPGYEWDEAGRMVKTADEQVRSDAHGIGSKADRRPLNAVSAWPAESSTLVAASAALCEISGGWGVRTGEIPVTVLPVM